MGVWLTQDWIDDTLELAAGMERQPGLSAVVDYVITDGPDGDREYFWDIQDGQLAAAGLGSSGRGDVKLTIEVHDAIAMQQGTLDANTAFMGGKIQVEGDIMKLLQLLPVTATEKYRQLELKLAERTDFSAW
jgi:putative sterol carrier protein